MSCRVCLWSAAGLLAAAMALSPLLAAPAPKTEAKEATTTAPEAIRKALDTPDNFEFKEQNLAAIITTISEQFKIQIVLDRNAVQMMGFVPEDLVVDLNMRNTKLRTALKALVGQYNLTFVISDGALLITTEESAVYRQLKQKVEVNFDNVPLQTAVREMSLKYGVNVVFDPKTVKNKTAMNPVTLQIDGVPFEAAMRLMCEMADLKPAKMGNVIYVTTEARADKLKDSDSLVPAPHPLMNPMMPGLNNLGFAGFAGGNLGNVVPVPAIAPPVRAEAQAQSEPAPKDAPARPKE